MAVVSKITTATMIFAIVVVAVQVLLASAITALPPATQPPLPITVDNCPSALNRDHFLKVYGQKCYRFFITLRKGFQEAENYCKQYGGNLALVKSKEINEFIYDELTTSIGLTSYTWIGLERNSSTNDFQWLDGTILTYENFNPNEKFLGAGYDYVGMYLSTGKWNTYTTDFEHPFICEFPPTSIPTRTTTTPAPDNCPSIDNVVTDLQEFGQKCYYFHLKQKLNFTTSQEFCERYGGNLVVITSREINHFLQNHVYNTLKFTKNLWIGLSYIPSTDRYVWVDGTREVYINYADLDPASGYGECLAMKPSTGKWVDVVCRGFVGSENLNFMCEFNSPTSTWTTLKTNSKSTTTTKPTSTAEPTSRPTTAMPTPTSTLGPQKVTCSTDICHLDCGLSGYVIDPVTQCMVCQCDN